jgi:hypothetical protein
MDLMPHIIAALFQDYATAQRALQAMMEAGVTRDRIAIVGENAGHQVSSVSGFRELSARDDAMAELHDLPLPDEDRRLFEEGLRQGHVLISARVDRANMEEAVSVIDMFDPLDVDRESAAWNRGAGAGGADLGAPLGAGLTGGGDAGQTNTAAVPGMGTMTDRTDDIGAAELRTDETATNDMGLSSTTATGGRRPEERAERPGVLELAQRSGDANAYRRETGRTGRVRAYSRD